MKTGFYDRKPAPYSAQEQALLDTNLHRVYFTEINPGPYVWYPVEETPALHYGLFPTKADAITATITELASMPGYYADIHHPENTTRIELRDGAPVITPGHYATWNLD